MAAFRFFLAIVLVCLSTYTEVVGLNHGWNLLPIFFSNIADSLRPVAWATYVPRLLALSVPGSGSADLGGDRNRRGGSLGAAFPARGCARFRG